MSRSPARFTQADANRAIKAVKQAGGGMEVRIERDGTIRIVPVDHMAVPEPKPEIGPKRRIVL